MDPAAPHPAFVAGATGFTGREVVRQLRARELPVVAHLRPGSEGSKRWRGELAASGAALLEVPWEAEALREAIAASLPAQIFCLIGTTRKLARREGLEASDIYDAVDRRLTELLLGAAVEAGVRPRFVYLSAIGADPASRSAYAAARGKAEAAVRASGLPYTIARPSVIRGEGRGEPRPAEEVAGRVLDGALGLLGALGARRLRDRYRSIDDVRLARALIEAALDPGCEGRILHGEELQRLGGSTAAGTPER